MKKHNSTLQVKLVLRCLYAGKQAVDTGKALGLPPKTVRTVCGNADKIRVSVQNVTPLSVTKKNHTILRSD